TATTEIYTLSLHDALPISVDVARDLDTGEFQGFYHVIQFAKRGVDVLQRHGAEPDEALRRALHHGGDLIVQVPDQNLRILERQPVGEELRHRRKRLARDAHPDHVLDAPRHAPAAVGHRAIDLARDHDVAVARVRLGHGRPRDIAPASPVRREILRDDVGMYVDAFAHRVDYRIGG